MARTKDSSEGVLPLELLELEELLLELEELLLELDELLELEELPFEPEELPVPPHAVSVADSNNGIVKRPQGLWFIFICMVLTRCNCRIYSLLEAEPFRLRVFVLIFPL